MDRQQLSAKRRRKWTAFCTPCIVYPRSYIAGTCRLRSSIQWNIANRASSYHACLEEVKKPSNLVSSSSPFDSLRMVTSINGDSYVENDDEMNGNDPALNRGLKYTPPVDGEIVENSGSMAAEILVGMGVSSLEAQEAITVAQEAALAAGIDPSAVTEDLVSVSKEAAAITETNWDVRISALLEDVSEHPDYYVSAVGAVSGASLVAVVASAALTAISAIPALAESLQVVGLGYTFWFMQKYLLSPQNRAVLTANVKDLLADARAPSSSLLNDIRKREIVHNEGQGEETG